MATTPSTAACRLRLASSSSCCCCRCASKRCCHSGCSSSGNDMMRLLSASCSQGGSTIVSSAFAPDARVSGELRVRLNGLCPLPCAPSDAWGAVAVVQDSRCVRPFDCRLCLSFVRSLALCLSQTRAIAPQHRGDAPPPRPPPLPLSSLPPFPPSPSSCMHPRKPCGRAVNSSWARIKDPPSARASRSRSRRACRRSPCSCYCQGARPIHRQEATLRTRCSHCRLAQDAAVVICRLFLLLYSRTCNWRPSSSSLAPAFTSPS